MVLCSSVFFEYLSDVVNFAQICQRADYRRSLIYDYLFLIIE